MSSSSNNAPNDGQDRCNELIRHVRQRRDASLSSVKPALPDLPADLPLNVVGLPRELLEPREIEITEKPAEELVKLLTQGKLSVIEVTKSFLRRAALAQRLVRTILSAGQ